MNDIGTVLKVVSVARESREWIKIVMYLHLWGTKQHRRMFLLYLLI